MKEAPRQNNIIYKITNTVTGKVYIGLTTSGLAHRKAGHKTRMMLGQRNHKLYQSMRKHGFDKFKFDTLCCALLPEYLPHLETMFIALHNSYVRGYNMNTGGSMVGVETREKLRAIFIGRKITWSDKIVASRLANPNRKDPKDFVAKGKHNTNSKWGVIEYCGKIICVKGLRQFCGKKGLTHSNLYATANGGQNYHRGYRLLGTFNDYPGTEYLRSLREMGGARSDMGSDIV